MHSLLLIAFHRGHILRLQLTVNHGPFKLHRVGHRQTMTQWLKKTQENWSHHLTRKQWLAFKRAATYDCESQLRYSQSHEPVNSAQSTTKCLTGRTAASRCHKGG
ncbi:unnamed protein product [Ixodes pacificus]